MSWNKPLPQPTPISAPFWDGLKAHEVRIQLDYLHDRQLVEVVKEPVGKWRAELTRAGVPAQEVLAQVIRAGYGL